MKTVIRFAVAVLFLIPFSTSALTTGIPFAGFVRATVPCTCSGGVLLIFDRVFTGLPVPVPLGALLYQPPASRPYANFNAGTPFTWNLGSYTPVPGVQAACLVGVPPVCVPTLVPVAGLGIVQKIGTSRPAFGILGF